MAATEFVARNVTENVESDHLTCSHTEDTAPKCLENVRAVSSQCSWVHICN